MSKHKVHYSSDKHDWATPTDLFNVLNAVYGFTVDVCANYHNHKAEKYFTPEQDGLKQDWSREICFMNPPYGREIKHWIKKAHDESKEGAVVVGLIPARTDTRYWHDHIFGEASIYFIKGRIKFEHPTQEETNSAPFPSAIVVWDEAQPNVIKGRIPESWNTTAQAKGYDKYE